MTIIFNDKHGTNTMYFLIIQMLINHFLFITAEYPTKQWHSHEFETDVKSICPHH